MPFKLTEDAVRDAGLRSEDIGYWCLLVDGCYHLFDREDQALQAYEKLKHGVLVR
ncbi:MAG: hypothetical protein AAGA89_05460 [Pseudomonadota bacterium]